jgi:hypothetical protein
LRGDLEREAKDFSSFAIIDVEYARSVDQEKAAIFTYTGPPPRSCNDRTIRPRPRA